MPITGALFKNAEGCSKFDGRKIFNYGTDKTFA